jgi:hypothetical protein
LLVVVAEFDCLFGHWRVCTRLHRIATRVTDSRRTKFQLHPIKTTFSVAVLKLLFEEGAEVQMAEWFQKQLHFPVFITNNSSEMMRQKEKLLFVDCLCLAAKGGCLHCNNNILLTICKYYLIIP